jgi:hypothetical protein
MDMLRLAYFMKLLDLILKREKKQTHKTREEYKRETLVQTGKEQFQKLQNLGLRLPVALS